MKLSTGGTLTKEDIKVPVQERRALVRRDGSSIWRQWRLPLWHPGEIILSEFTRIKHLLDAGLEALKILLELIVICLENQRLGSGG